MNKQLLIVVAVVIKSGKVLMTKRSEPGCREAHMKWELPGGKVDFGETPDQAIRREVLEETGVKVKIERMANQVQTIYWDYEWGKQQTLVLCFKCQFISKTKPRPDPKVEKIDWIDLEKLDSLELLNGTKQLIDLSNDHIIKKPS